MPTASAPAIRSRSRSTARSARCTLVGVALSPEFVYTIGPGSIMPDDERFGVMWMAEDVLAAAFNLSGAFNSVTLGVTRGTDLEPVKDELERLLKPYGGTGPYDREQQMSNAFLDGELEQLDVMARVIPPIFLVVSAFLVNMVLGRLITLEREQIGLLKALGYSTAEIAWHYLKLSIGIGAIGVLIGWVAGYSLSKVDGDALHRVFQVPLPRVHAAPAGLRRRRRRRAVGHDGRGAVLGAPGGEAVTRRGDDARRRRPASARACSTG